MASKFRPRRIGIPSTSKKPGVTAEISAEGSLPGGVRVSRIVVNGVRNQDDRTIANLDLTVASKNPSLITQMIEDMESQGVFRAELVAQNPQRGKGEAGSEYELNVHYVPRAGFAIEPSASKRPVDTASEGGKTR